MPVEGKESLVFLLAFLIPHDAGRGLLVSLVLVWAGGEDGQSDEQGSVGRVE